VREDAPAKELTMDTASSAQSPSTRQKATVVRTYGPFPVERVHGVTHDGTHVWFGEDKIRKVDPKTGRVVATLATPGTTNDNSGLAWEGDTLWVGQYKGRAIHQIDATTGKVLKTLHSDRFVTGVSYVDGDLWHGTWEEDTAELRRIDPATGRVLQTLEMPPDGVSGLEAKGDILFCGGIKTPVVRAVKRPTRQ
jgi:glutamine cyclotransferase